MLVLEEGVYKCDSFLENLFQLDRKLIHSVKDFDPYTSVMLPRFYKTEVLKKAFASIPQELLESIGGQDHAIIYLEAWKVSTKVDLLSSAVMHIEPNSISHLCKKFYRWGLTSVAAQKSIYSPLLARKEKFRKGLFSGGHIKQSFASILLLLLKGVPFKLGRLVGSLKK